MKRSLFTALLILALALVSGQAASQSLGIVPDAARPGIFTASSVGQNPAQIEFGKLGSRRHARIGWECATGKEQYFVSLQRGAVLAGTAKPTLTDDIVRVSVGDIADIWKTTDGRMEWDIEFASKPSTNKYEWEIEFAEGVKFYKQRTLEEEWADDNEGQTLEKYLAGRNRPENVINSYAIYCDKAGRFLDLKGEEIANYGAGKLGHIYRPLCTDDEGRTAWASMDIEQTSPTTGTLSIVIPQTFLDAAVYPVVLDPTFGVVGSCGGTKSSALTAGRIYVSGTGTPASNGTLTSIDICSDTNTAAGQDIDVGLYDDVTGTPTNLVGSPNATADVGTWDHSGSAEWHQFTSASTAVVSTTTYWPAFNHSTTTSLTIQYDTGTGDQRFYQTDDYGTSWPDPFVSASQSTSIFSMRGTYTATATGAAQVIRVNID